MDIATIQSTAKFERLFDTSALPLAYVTTSSGCVVTQELFVILACTHAGKVGQD